MAVAICRASSAERSAAESFSLSANQARIRMRDQQAALFNAIAEDHCVQSHDDSMDHPYTMRTILPKLVEAMR